MWNFVLILSDGSTVGQIPAQKSPAQLQAGEKIVACNMTTTTRNVVSKLKNDSSALSNLTIFTNTTQIWL